MNGNRKQSFLFGAIILVCANFIVKLIGFIFKIPLFNLVGEVGMGYYNAAYSLYVGFFTISTAGLPVAISRMIAVANSQKNYREEKKIFRLSMIIFMILGTVGTMVMFFGAEGFANAAKNPYARYSLMMISPTLFFICITSAYRGFFQGRQNMIPTAISEIIEALGKLAVGLIAILYAIGKGYDAPIIAAYAVSGLTIGVAVGAGFLALTKMLAKTGEEEYIANASIPKVGLKTPLVRDTPAIVREIIKISLPITLSSSLISLSGVIDTFVMTRRLMDIGYTEEAATGAYGSYMTMAVSFFNFPNALVVPFAVSIIPVIATAYANKNMNSIKSTIESTFRMVSIIAMPSAFGIAAMANPILNLVFNDKGSVSRTAPLLSVLSIAIVFVSMVSVTNSMLQAQKQENKTIVSMAFGSVVKLVGSFVLVGIPAIGRFGTPISTCLCYFTIMSLNFFFLSKNTSVIPALKRTFMKPFISSAVTGFSAIVIFRLARIAMPDKIATLTAILIAVVVYLIMLFMLKTLTREDILLLPKGIKIYSVLKKFNLVN